MKFVKKENNYRIYELEAKECEQFNRQYPTYLTWSNESDIGNMCCIAFEGNTIEYVCEYCNAF